MKTAEAHNAPLIGRVILPPKKADDEEEKNARLIRAMRKPGTVLHHPDGSLWRVDHMGILRKIGLSDAERELEQMRRLEAEVDEKIRQKLQGETDGNV